jgi:beta-lactamase superfamily II metal-dependent hydrolase
MGEGHGSEDTKPMIQALHQVWPSAMNNTSLVLLFEVGNTCLLFPGDAQWENWQYALGQKKYLKLLKRVNFYKVGHHRASTPRRKRCGRRFRTVDQRRRRIASSR